MSRCDDIRAGLDEWLDRQADEAVLAEIEAHLAECGDCARYFADHRRLAADLADLGRAADRIGATAPTAAPVQRRAPRQRVWASVAAAAVIVAAAGLYLAQSWHGGRVAPLADAVVQEPPRAGPDVEAPLDPPPAKTAGFYIEPPDGFLVVNVPSSNPNIHIVWLYPELRTLAAPASEETETEVGTPR